MLLLTARCSEGYKDYVARSYTNPGNQLGSALSVHLFEDKYAHPDVERRLDGTACGDGAIKRCGELDCCIVRHLLIHPDSTVDVFGDGLGLRTRIARVQDDDASTLFAHAEELCQSILSDRLGQALIVFKYDLMRL